MAELSYNQKAFLNAFDDGVKFATRRMYEKLFYIPDAWKEGNTLALYNVILKTLEDLDTLVSREGS